uniref:G patch domain containing 1 n=1 Tax=Neogobius melanostomus TaxID=47308 RepID=A0A8C6UW55_9GOBI
NMAADSDKEGTDFVSFGTPLEPLDEDEPLKKPVPIYEQTVKDEKGRYQRFHGAFTGGFSAGYFNTVGSKEGWSPATFKSSRESKAENQKARGPEDFMDEEDFGEHGIAPSEITRSAEFQSGHKDAATAKARAVNAQSSLIPGDTLLEEIIAPAESSIGVELLKTMGWREGQGIGPRVKRKPKKQRPEEGPRVYGCSRPPAGSESSEEDDGEFAPQNVTFAPKDVTPFDFTPHLGLQGLGYRGLDPGLALGQSAEHINLFDPQLDIKTKLFGGKQKHTRHRGVAGQGFGVGAMEDEDEDIYQRDSMSKYDIEIKDEEPGDGLFGWTALRNSNKDASYIGKILEGFTLAQKTVIFPPPRLPRDYRPVRRFNPGTFVSHVSGVSPALAQPQTGGRHQLDSGQRRALIGEEALQGPSSVMDLLRPEDRERLRNIRHSRHGSSSSSRSSSSSLPPKKESGQTAAQTFKPFENNPEKQERYEQYLNCLKQGDTDALEESLDSEMTEWERSREREEFVRASILYRPSSSFLSSRFTRSKQQDDDDTVEVNRDEERDLDDKQTAVKMKMFGQLTRETFEWHPDKVLCKRFNVPDPFPGTSVVGLPKVKRDKFSVFNFLIVPESKETSGNGYFCLHWWAEIQIPRDETKHEIESTRTRRDEILT